MTPFHNPKTPSHTSTPHRSHPSFFIAQHSPFITHPGTFIQITHPTSVTLTLISHPSSLTSHHSPLFTHPSSLTPHHSPLITHPSSITSHRSPLITHPSSLTHSSLIFTHTHTDLHCPKSTFHVLSRKIDYHWDSVYIRALPLYLAAIYYLCSKVLFFSRHCPLGYWQFCTIYVVHCMYSGCANEHMSSNMFIIV